MVFCCAVVPGFWRSLFGRTLTTKKSTARRIEQFRGFQEAIDAADEVAATMPAPTEVSPLLNGRAISVFMPYSAHTR